MKMRTLWITAILLLLALPGTVTAQDQNRFLKMSVAELAQTWLLRNCGIEEEKFLKIAITRHARELTPLFNSALEQGAPERLAQEVREGAMIRFNRNRIALEDAKRLGLSPEDVQRARDRTVEDFTNRAVLSFKTGYRSQARRGLSLLGVIKPLPNE